MEKFNINYLRQTNSNWQSACTNSFNKNKRKEKEVCEPMLTYIFSISLCLRLSLHRDGDTLRIIDGDLFWENGNEEEKEESRDR
jgi:hypothetical protein